MSGRERNESWVGLETRQWLLGGVALSGLVTFGSHLVFPAMLIPMTNTFGISNTTAGIVFSLIAVVNGGLQYPSGALADFAGGTKVLLGGLSVFAIGVGFVMLPGPFEVFVVGAMLLAVGTGLVGTVRYIVASNAYPERTDFAFSVVSAAANLGSVVLPALAVTVALRSEWRLSFGILLPFAVCAAGLLLFNSTNEPTEDASRTTSALALLRHLRTWLWNGRFLSALAILTLMTFVYYGLTSFFPTYLVYQKSMTQTTSSFYYSVLLLSGVTLTVVSGYLADRYGSLRILILLVTLTAIGLFVLPIVTTPATILTVTIVFGSQMGIWPVCQSYVLGMFPDQVEGNGLGLLRTLFLALGSGGSAVVGAFVDANLFDVAFVFLGCVALLGLVLAVWLARQHRRESE